MAAILFAILPLLLSVALFVVSVSSTSAQEEQPLGDTPPYGGIDLVFLVDQSGSMRENDPYSQRANAIKWVLQYLGIDNLYTRRDAIHRIGVVSFGTDAVIDLELTPLRAIDENEWNTRYAEVQEKVVAKNLVNTDVLKGLQLVQEVFKAAPGQEEGKQRTRGIIILTDGAPYREGWQQDPRYAGTNFYTPYFREIREFVDANLPIARSPRSTDGYHIWVLGLNAKEEQGREVAPGTSWLDQENYWERILNPSLEADRVRRISSERNAKIPDDIVRVLDTMMVGGVCNDDAEPTDKPSCIVEEEFTVPPYVARANFSIFKPQPTSQIAFFTPDNQLLDRSSASVEVKGTGEVIETVVVENPPAGRWKWQKLDTSAGRATVVFQSLFGQAKVLEPRANQDLFDTIVLHIALQDLKGQRMVELAGYPIDIQASVVFPDGKQFLYEMISQGDGTWRSRQSILLEQPGTYQIFLDGSTRDINGKPVKLFSRWRAEFTAGSLVPTLVQPAGDVSLFHQTPIEISLKKPDGSDPGVSAQYAVKLEGELVMPDGRTSALDFRQGSSPSVYVANPVIARLPGRHSIKVLGSMELGDKVTTLFEKDLNFNVDCVRAEMPAPAGDQPQNGVTTVEVLITNCLGTPYREDAALPWTVTADVEGPGTQRSMPLAKSADGVYNGQFSPDVAGTWEIATSAQVTSPAGEVFAAFDGLVRSVEVYPTTQVRLHVLSPKAQERQRIRSVPRVPPIPESRLGRAKSLQIRVEVLDFNDQPLQLEDLADAPDKIAAATLFGPAALAVGKPVTLTLAPDNPNHLLAEIPDLRDTGPYTLSVAFDALRREYLPESQQSVVVPFQRSDPFAVITYGILAIELLLLALLLFLLVRAVVVRINPVKGTLEFEAIGGGSKQSLGMIALGRYGKNAFVIDENALRTQLDTRVAEVVAKIKIKNASARRAGRSASLDPESTDSAAIKVWGWGPDKELFADGQEFPAGISDLLVGDIYMRYNHE